MRKPARIAGVIALIVGAVLVYRYVLFPPSARLSAEEVATLQSLEPRMPELLISHADAAAIAGEVHDCLQPAASPGEVIRGETRWCTESGSIVGSTIIIPRDGDVPVELVAREVELHAGSPGKAASLADGISALTPIEGSARFMDIAAVGPYSHTLRFRGQYPGNIKTFDFYNVFFLENWISAEITIVLPGANSNDQTATTMAQTVYTRIALILAERATPPEAPTATPPAEVPPAETPAPVQ